MGNENMMVGLTNIAIVDRTTKELEAMFKVTDGGNIDKGETFVVGKGGADIDACTADIVDSNDPLTVTVKEFSDEALENIWRNASSESVNAAGAVTTLTNLTGTSAVDAATGMASIAATAAGVGLKEGKYIVKVVSATTVDIYGYTGFDTLNLADEETGKVNSAVYTIVDTGATVDVTELAVTITSGSGTVLMVVDDTAEFTVNKIGTTTTFPIGGESNKEYKEVWFFYQESTGRTLGYYRWYKCLVARGALSTPIKDYGTMEMTIIPTRDSDQSNKIGLFTRTKE